MQRLLIPTVERLNQFIDQRDQLALILRSRTDDSLPITKVLEGLEDPHPSDLFWFYTDDFKDAHSYASQIVDAFAVKHLAVKSGMQQAGMRPWKDIPAAVLSQATEPALRLKTLAAFSRELLPIPFGGNNVWIFYPMNVDDHAAYAALMQRVLAHEFPNPWCHHLRFIVREDVVDSRLSSALAPFPSIALYEPDLSIAAVEKSLHEDVEDDRLPLDERVSSSLVLAGIDLAHCRFDAALEKYALALKYYGSVNNYAMAAVALNSMGEAYVRLGDNERANQAFESALIPASHGENPPLQVFLNVALNLATLRMAEKNWLQAAGYWDVVQQLSVGTRDASMKIRALDQLGYCHYRLQDVSAAEKSWHDGAILAADLEDKQLEATLLERRRSLYIETNQPVKEQAVAAQLAALKA